MQFIFLKKLRQYTTKIKTKIQQNICLEFFNYLKFYSKFFCHQTQNKVEESPWPWSMHYFWKVFTIMFKKIVALKILTLNSEIVFLVKIRFKVLKFYFGVECTITKVDDIVFKENNQRFYLVD